MCAAWGLACVIAIGAGAIGGVHAGVVILAVSGIVFAVGECLHAVVVQPLIAELAPPALVGRYMALFGITFSVGLAAGPSASASALAVSPELPWLAGAAAMLALLPVLSPVVRRAQVPREEWAARRRARDRLMLAVARLAPFRDRAEAGRKLAAELPALERPIVLALPRGGVPVGAAVAGALGAPLDVFVVRKLGSRYSRSSRWARSRAAACASSTRACSVEAAVPAAVLEEVAARESAAVESRERSYRGDRPAPQLAGRDVVLVDDGLATGATMRAAVAAVLALAPTDSSLRCPSRRRRRWRRSRGTASSSCALRVALVRLGWFVVRRFRAGIG